MTGMQLNQDQERALDAVVDGFHRGKSFQRIVGAAGTGKTTMLAAVVEAMGRGFFVESESEGRGVAVLAPTNKAAMILRQKGLRNATTCHRAVSFAKPPSEDELETLSMAIDTAREQEKFEDLLALELRFEEANKLRFQQRGSSPYRKASLLIVDEAGMVSGEVADWLRDLGVPILAIGDPYQLPPVQDPRPGSAFLAGLRDPAIPTHVLRTIERQGAGSGILEIATKIRQGVALPSRGRVSDDVVILDLGDPGHNRHWKHYKADLFRKGYQFITYTNHARRCLINDAREALHRYDRKTGPKAGERYIAVQTNRRLDVLNADAVALSDITFAPVSINAKVDVLSNPHAVVNHFHGPVSVYRGHFEDTLKERRGPHEPQDRRRPHESWLQLDWSYAMTCHKMQGDEADRVVVLLEGGADSRWAYTAVSRARERLYIVRAS
jgi:exodeoxyribonuclease-5